MTLRDELIAARARADFAAIERIMFAAQNDPPEGGNDGSINELEWHALAALWHARANYIAKRDAFLRVWRLRA